MLIATVDIGYEELLSQDNLVQHVFLSQGCCGGRQVSWKFQEIDHFMFQLGIGWRLFLFLFFHTLIEAKLQNTQTYRRLEFVAHLKHQE